jgi:hypothetical protein
MSKGQTKYDIKTDAENTGLSTYYKMLKIPENKGFKIYDEQKQYRLKHGKTVHLIDFRPRAIFREMKMEIILFIFGLGFAVCKIDF